VKSIELGHNLCRPSADLLYGRAPNLWK